MATTTTTHPKIEKAFDEFERNAVRLPEALNKQAQEVHPKVRAAAEAAFPGETTSWLGGSYGRKTQSGPTLKDIDVIVEFDDVDDMLLRAPSGFLDKVARAVMTCDLVRTAEPRRRAVECSLHSYEFTVDIVPGICHPDGKRLYLANHSIKDGTNEWQLLNPRGQRDAARARNEETGALYIRVVRIVKYWNQRFGKENKPLRSYHAEALVYHSIEGADGFAEAVVAFFDHAYKMLAPGSLTADPGDPGQYIDLLLEDHERLTARERLAQARDKAHEAAELDDPDEAAEVWGQIFGPGFPSPSMSSANVRRALAGGVGIAGTGLSPSQQGREVVRGRSWRPR